MKVFRIGYECSGHHVSVFVMGETLSDAVEVFEITMQKHLREAGVSEAQVTRIQDVTEMGEMFGWEQYR